MIKRRVVSGVLATCLVAALSTCSDSGTGPDGLAPFGPRSAVLDGAHGGNAGFYFLPPLGGSPSPSGTFNPNLSPTVEVCALDAASVCDGPPVVTFEGDAITVSSDKYQLSWDTDGPETPPLDISVNYRITVLVSGVELGYLDVNPQDPNGTSPSEDTPELYAFRLGETIPVKFWIGVGAVCDSDDPLVVECAEATISDETGGSVSVANQGAELGVTVVPDGLPDVDPEVLLIVERISTAELEDEGTTCIPLLDAPQFGSCLRVRTIPELSEPLEIPAIVSLCVDLDAADFAQLKSEAQRALIQAYRYATDGSGIIQLLPNTSSSICGDTRVGMLEVPDHGLLRYAAIGVNALARVLGPEPVAAAHLGLGSLTISFSRFSWGIPVWLQVDRGDDQSAPAGSTLGTDPRVKAVDANGEPVEGATVHFTVTGGDGTRAPESVVTGADGLASATWTLGSEPGTNSLFAGGLGLLAPDTELDPLSIQLTEVGGLTFSATAVGPPASVEPSAGDGQSANVGETLPDPLVVTVTDVNGVPVEGASLTWAVTSGGGSLDGEGTTGADGTAQASWTLGTAAGPQGASATANGITADFSATATPGPAALLTKGGDGQTGYVGAPLPQPLSVTVADQYGNVRQGDVVTWSVTSGGGSVSPTSGATGADGSAQTTWTMGSAPGTASLTASVQGLAATFSATPMCFDGYGTAVVDGALGTSEWACARSLPFTANISGGATPAEVLWMNDASTLYMAVRVEQRSFDKANNLRFDFDNDGDGLHETGDDAIGYDADASLFFDEWLTGKCANSGQSGCGAADTQIDGSGAATNDGTWTMYEVSHPLSSGDPNDFSLAKGSIAGFFLTLRSGKGAQGNTQIPGFRIFQTLTIVGY